MRVLIQRVRKASVTVAGEVIGAIDAGILVLIGIAHSDQRSDADWLAKKVAGLRIFEDDQGKMNLSLKDVNGGILVVSQFTLYGDCRKGRRPGFDAAALPAVAEPLYEYFVQAMKQEGISRVETGKFGADMLVSLENDGPVTFLIDYPPIEKERMDS